MRLVNINVRFDKLRIVLAVPVASSILLVSAAAAQAEGLAPASIGSPDCSILKKSDQCCNGEGILQNIRFTADARRDDEGKFRNAPVTRVTESGFSCDQPGSRIAMEPIRVNHGGELLRPDDTFQFENPGGVPASEPEPVSPPATEEQQESAPDDSFTESDRSIPPETGDEVQSSPESPQTNSGMNTSQSDAPVYDPRTQTIYDPQTRTIYDAPETQNNSQMAPNVAPPAPSFATPVPYDAPPAQITEGPIPEDDSYESYRQPANGNARIQRPGMLAVPNTRANSEFQQTTQRVKSKLPRKAPPAQRDGADPEEATLRLLVHELEFGTLAKSISILQQLNQEYPGDPDYVRLLSMSLNLRDGDIWYSYQRKSDRPAPSIAPAQPPKPAVPVLRQNPNNNYVNDLKRESWFLINQSDRHRSN